ncbi:hypothetical protein RSSM_02833 [Rhodopirellula sallentina SM41]|uniref:Secreted protein n=1 Tax=Rhodopirellula sallentina SM41 TaxID=1263870 RepID=M5UD20_9BACT|nr:hypothetical protein RSSM_02833 [Rhodopirellula sallentina SM41]
MFSVAIGCSSSEPTSVADGLSQEQIDDYNALVEEEARRAADAGDIGKGE